MIKPKNFGLWGNTDKSVFWQILPKIIDWTNINKIQIYITEKIQTDVEFNANSYYLHLVFWLALDLEKLNYT